MAKTSKGGKRRLKIPQILTAEEQERLVAALPPTDLTQFRNLCMVLLMLGMGLRSAEVVNLRRRDLEMSHGELAVRDGKGGKDRILWVPKKTMPSLTAFVQFSPDAKPSDLVFQTASGNQVDTRFLRTMVEAAGRRAGIIKRLHPHMLRHTFASNLFRETKNLLYVSKALGHANLSTTEIYLHLVDGELENAMKESRYGQ